MPAAVPFRNPVADARTLLATPVWVRWLQSLVDALKAKGSLSLTAQGAAVAATALGTELPAGLYRVSYALRVTRAATSSSSVAITVRWTDGGVACAQSFAAVTGNTTATVQSNSLLLRADARSSVTVETTYGSVGATTMQFALDARLDLLP